MVCNIKAVIGQHPDWYAVNGKGQSAHTHPAYVDYYKFLCPCHPEVQEFVEGNVKALAKYEALDGIHLDYIRVPDVILAEALQPKYNIVQDKEYPEYDYSYSAHCRSLFREQTGLEDPLEMKEPAASREWKQFRFDQITHLVNEKLVPAAKSKNKSITAAVFPNWQSVRQQWHHWNLDAFLPMLYHNFYNADIQWIKEETRKGVEGVRGGQPIYSGLFVPSLPPSELREAILASNGGGGNGVSLFNMNSLTEEHWKVFTETVKGF